MASVKRKAVTDQRPSKRAKPSDGKDSSKKAKDGGRTPKAAKAAKAENDEAPQRKSAAKSILQLEEKSFPRGGASVLTPLEHKQIRAEAERDALIEHETGQTFTGQDEVGDLFDETVTAAATKGKQKSKRKSESQIPKVEGSGIKIQGLSYKNLAIGSIVLGRVTAITSRDIALALPNNLTGFVPITAISQRLTSRMLGATGQDNEDEEETGADIDMKAMFHVGQWLRAAVTATTAGAKGDSGKTKRHIELSIDPALANSRMESDNVVANSMLQASVRSVEDHGIIMDLGLADESVRGFVSKKELGTAYAIDDMQEGQVVLGLVTGKASNGKVVNLSLNPARYSATTAEKAPVLNEAPTVDSFLPGTAVNILVTDSGAGGVVGKVMGMLDMTADLIHCGSYVNSEDVSKHFKMGSKMKARIIWTLPGDDGARTIGISTLEQALALTPQPPKLPKNATAKQKSLAADLEQAIPASSIVEDAKVVRIMAERGLFLTFPNPTNKAGSPVLAFAHISQLSDGRIDSISSNSGAHKLDTTHKVRVLSYNPIDNIYYVSLKQSTLDQAFLRVEDVSVGTVVEGTVEKLILGGARGIVGVLVKLSDHVTGLVPEMHFSDTQLKHPDRKFREGFPITARVLSVNADRRELRLTLKKSLVEESDATRIWHRYSGLEPGMSTNGTIISLSPTGAVVQFFGGVRAWLPIAEMSATYIQSPEHHFHLGTTVSVRILSVHAEAEEMKVSCRDNVTFDGEQKGAWDQLDAGHIVNGTVSEKTADGVIVELKGGLKGTIRVGHLIDGSAAKSASALKRIRIGQQMANLLVLNKLDRSQTLLLSNQPAMLEDTNAGQLIKSFTDVVQGSKVHGFVRNITPEAVYVEFAGEMVGLVSKSQVLPEALDQPDFGLRKDQTLGLWVTHLDAIKERFFLSMREQKDSPLDGNAQANGLSSTEELKNPVDPTIKAFADFSLGKITKARIASIKATQINVRLADGVQGRIDVSEAFNSWDEIKTKTAPLSQFTPEQVIDVKILGIHDARTHRFLPISHRHGGKTPLFELSAKKSRLEGSEETLVSLDSVKPGSSYLAFINNHGDNHVWVSLSPNVKGRVAFMDLTDDVGSLQDVEKHFRIGRALRTTVKTIDLASNRLDLTAKQAGQSGPTTLKDLSPGMTMPARVTKATERSIVVQLADNLVGLVPLVEMHDDFALAYSAQYNKNDIVRVCVLDVDLANKKVYLTLRPSKVLSSSLPVVDRHITDATQLKTGDIVRGFIKNVAEKSVFVSLSARVDARVRVSDLSDKFVKDWKSIVEIDQLVKGRIISVDAASRDICMSIKQSHVDADYKPPLTFADLKVGQIVTGKVRKVEDYGAFIDIDDTQPRVSGLCHKSEVAAKPVEDVRKLYSEGDVVKAKVLKINSSKRQISLGLKAKYFQAELDEDEDDDEQDAEAGGVEVVVDGEEDSDLSAGEVDLDDIPDLNSDDGEAPGEDAMDLDEEALPNSTAGLKTKGFDWTGDNMDVDGNGAVSESEHETTTKKRRRNKPEIKVDMTGDLDKYGPRSVSDFERQLLGQPNNSGLWIQYMAFQLQLSEIQKARDVAERAIRTIHIREMEDKANVWIAWLNLEVEYGDEERLEEVFKQACQVQDPLEMHEKLVSIYIDSGKHAKADAIFERIVANKTFRASPAVWLNYATFLMDQLQKPEEARALLSRGLQSISIAEHRPLTTKFAALEFHSLRGDPERGRTIFEGIVAEWPKWHSGWDTWADLERAQIARAESTEGKDEAREKVRALYERMAGLKMKKRRAKFFFKRWLEFEEHQGTKERVKGVEVRAAEFVERLKGGDEELEE